MATDVRMDVQAHTQTGGQTDRGQCITPTPLGWGLIMQMPVAFSVRQHIGFASLHILFENNLVLHRKTVYIRPRPFIINARHISTYSETFH